MIRIADKKVHAKTLHSLSVMERRTLAEQTENVPNIATPKGQHGIVSLVKRTLYRLILEGRGDD